MSEYFSSEDHLISSQTDIQINMQLFIYLSIVLVTVSSAQQLKNGPQILSEVSSSAESSHKIDKRYVTPEFNLYFTKEDVQALQAMHSSQNSDSVKILQHKPVIGEQYYNELIQKLYDENLKPAPIEEPQEEKRHSSPNFFLQREESIYNKKPNFDINTYRQLLMDQTKLSRHASAQKNNLNQLEFFKPASDSNKNKDQRKSFLEKEKEYFLRNGQIYQSQQLNSPIPVRSQNSDKNEGQDQSAIEKEIEKAWKQYLAHEIKRLNSPVEVSKEILSAGKEKRKNIEVEKPILYILNKDRYGFEKFNVPSEVNNKDSQGRNEKENESEVESEIKKFWSKQLESQLHHSFYPTGVFTQGPSGINENKKKSEVDKQIDIFNQQDIGFERSFSPVVVSQQRASGKNENLENLELYKQFEYIIKNHDAEFQREKILEVKNQSPLVLSNEQNKSDVEKEIENVLKKHQEYEFQRSKSATGALSQSHPIKIHEHVSITKHFAVPVVNTLQVAVPTPVLVQIPQRYEVKVPHLYPAPHKIVKHVPVSVLNHD